MAPASAAVGPTADEGGGAAAGAEAEAEAEAEAVANPEWCSERASTSEHATRPTVEGRFGVLLELSIGGGMEKQ